MLGHRVMVLSISLSESQAHEYWKALVRGSLTIGEPQRPRENIDKAKFHTGQKEENFSTRSIVYLLTQARSKWPSIQ